VSVRWSCRPRRKRKTVGGYAASAAILLQERIRHTNRIKGLLAGQGITDFNPLHKDRRQLLDAARTGDGRPLPLQLKAEILREIELIELLLRQIADVEAAREVLAGPKTAKAPSPVVLLEQLKRHRSGRSLQSFTSKASPKLRQPPPVGSLCGARANTMAERHGRPGARHLQSG